MHVIGYLRVSTDEQARSGLGLEDQRQRVEQEILRRDWTVRWSIDDGYSASSLCRPGITEALAELRTGRAQALVVSKLDRLSRSLIDFAALMESAKREGWALIALDLGVDMTTPAGEMMASVMASFAQYERRLIAQRTKDALAVLKSRGRRLGRPVAVSPTTSAAIGRWRASGLSYQACADALNAEGAPTAHGGQRWYASTVRSVVGSLQLDAQAGVR